MRGTRRTLGFSSRWRRSSPGPAVHIQLLGPDVERRVGSSGMAMSAVPFGGSSARRHDELLAVGHADLVEDPRQVGLHGLGSHQQFGGDLGFGEPFGAEVGGAGLGGRKRLA